MGIRVVPNETIPAQVCRILLPHERPVIAVRFHPAAVVGSLVAAVGGLFRSDVAMLPLPAAARLRFRRSAAGRLLGYGQFIRQDAGGGRGQLRVNLLPYPEQLYIEVLGLLFPDRQPGD